MRRRKEKPVGNNNVISYRIRDPLALQAIDQEAERLGTSHHEACRLQAEYWGGALRLAGSRPEATPEGEPPGKPDRQSPAILQALLEHARREEEARKELARKLNHLIKDVTGLKEKLDGLKHELHGFMNEGTAVPA